MLLWKVNLWHSVFVRILYPLDTITVKQYGKPQSNNRDFHLTVHSYWTVLVKNKTSNIKQRANNSRTKSTLSQFGQFSCFCSFYFSSVFGRKWDIIHIAWYTIIILSLHDHILPSSQQLQSSNWQSLRGPLEARVCSEPRWGHQDSRLRGRQARELHDTSIRTSWNMPTPHIMMIVVYMLFYSTRNPTIGMSNTDTGSWLSLVMTPISEPHVRRTERSRYP